MYGFIYETTCLVNGKKYIGKKTYDKKGDWRYYLGSGTILKRAVEKYGRENFKREILCECETKEELSQKEREYIAKANAVLDPLYYNIASGGEGGMAGVKFTEDHIRKVVETHYKKVICVETGEIFESALAASENLGFTHGAVANAIKRNLKCGGFNFRYLEDYDPNEVIKDKTQNKKKVVCVETGEVFESAAAASRSVGRKNEAVSKAIFQNTRCGGYHWAFID